MKRILVFLLLELVMFNAARAGDPVPTPPDNTLSPDKYYGITVPASETDGGGNDLVEMKSMRVVGHINADVTGYARARHARVLPAFWSADDSYLLWQVYGKWGMETQMLVCLEGGGIKWELDVIKVLQRQILTRTEAADPKTFLAAKKKNWGDGSAYPEKFVIDSQAQYADKSALTFPVRFHVYLTSNCKGFDGVPEVDSKMEATLSRDGEIKITAFQMGRSKSAPWYEIKDAPH